MTVDLAVHIKTNHHPKPVLRAEYRSNNTWKLVPLKRPKKFHPGAWSTLIALARLNFRFAKVQALLLSIDWNCYPLHPDRALAVHIAKTVENGEIVQPMDEDLLYLLS